MKRKILCITATIVLVVTTVSFKNSEECDKITMTVDETATKIELEFRGDGKVCVDWGDDKITTATISAINQVIRHSYNNFDESHHVTIEAAEIKTFTCKGKGIVLLDVSKCKHLEQLRCSFVNLKSLYTGNNIPLKLIECKNNRLESLDVSKFINLESLWCSNNNIKFLSTVNNRHLKTIVCEDNNMDSLDIRGNIELSLLSCQRNRIKSIDLSTNIALRAVICGSNPLKSIDISKNTLLEILFCQKNQIELLDISKNVALKQVDCNNNQIKYIKLNKNIDYAEIYCNNNQISADKLNKMFKKLYNNTDKKYKKFIHIENNLGTETCKTSIAEKKGWKVIRKSF
ncbi:MAG: hypothetical protein LBD59_12415 [Prevotellaceae bacterium]|jgi:hypothetical protein|nr:hypothetical protein [Prevotellaceae bacterium]